MPLANGRLDTEHFQCSTFFLWISHNVYLQLIFLSPAVCHTNADFLLENVLHLVTLVERRGFLPWAHVAVQTVTEWKPFRLEIISHSNVPSPFNFLYASSTEHPRKSVYSKRSLNFKYLLPK